jgi:superfamily II DNA or RNA helicase
LDALASEVVLTIVEDTLAEAQRQRERREMLLNLHLAEDATVGYGNGLDPYQRVGVKFLVAAERALLAYDLGMGKTVIAIRAAIEAGAKRILVVTKKSLVYQWLREIEKWTR